MNYKKCLALVLAVFMLLTFTACQNKRANAVVIGDTGISAAELHYYYTNAVNKFYTEWGLGYGTDNLSALLGLDINQPLNAQFYDAEKGKTWADYFTEMAIESLKHDIVLSKEAKSAGFTPDEKVPGYNQYLEPSPVVPSFGLSRPQVDYVAIAQRAYLADAYAVARENSYVYDDATLRAYEDGRKADFNSYSYERTYISRSYFLFGGTAVNDTVIYTEKELSDASAQLEAYVNSILEGNEPMPENTSLHTRVAKDAISTGVADWLTDEARQPGDFTAIPYTDASNQLAGYYLVKFIACHDNSERPGNVRHLLVSFGPGTEDPQTGETVYDPEEKAAAKKTAEEYLQTWRSGDATEEAFIALVKEHSADPSSQNGGLYENIAPDASYVENFLNWSTDQSRRAGDTDIIETEYGYHVMYFVGFSEMTYRDQLISEELGRKDYQNWYETLISSTQCTVNDTSALPTGKSMADLCDIEENGSIVVGPEEGNNSVIFHPAS